MIRFSKLRSYSLFSPFPLLTCLFFFWIEIHGKISHSKIASAYRVPCLQKMLFDIPSPDARLAFYTGVFSPTFIRLCVSGFFPIGLILKSSLFSPSQVATGHWSLVALKTMILGGLCSKEASRMHFLLPELSSDGELGRGRIVIL